MRPRALSPSPAVRRPGSWVGTRPRSPKPKEAEKHRDRSETSWPQSGFSPHTGPAGKFARLPSSPPPPAASPGEGTKPQPRTGAYILASGSEAKGQRADVRPRRSCPPRSGLGRCRGRGRARPRDVLPESEPHTPSFGSGCFDARPNGFRKIKII